MLQVTEAGWHGRMVFVAIAIVTWEVGFRVALCLVYVGVHIGVYSGLTGCSVLYFGFQLLGFAFASCSCVLKKASFGFTGLGLCVFSIFRVFCCLNAFFRPP